MNVLYACFGRYLRATEARLQLGHRTGLGPNAGRVAWLMLLVSICAPGTTMGLASMQCLTVVRLAGSAVKDLMPQLQGKAHILFFDHVHALHAGPNRQLDRAGKARACRPHTTGARWPTAAQP